MNNQGVHASRGPRSNLWEDLVLSKDNKARCEIAQDTIYLPIRVPKMLSVYHVARVLLTSVSRLLTDVAPA